MLLQMMTEDPLGVEVNVGEPVSVVLEQGEQTMREHLGSARRS